MSAVAPVRADPPDDVRLLVAVASGDRAALATLYDRHVAAMLGLATRILGDRQSAEDLVHDVFLEAWNKAASFDARRGTVRGWLMLRVRSRAIDRIRVLASARKAAIATPCVPTPPEADGDPGRRADCLRARRALVALTAEQRDVLELSYFSGLSCSEIAARRGTPIGTVKSRLRAGMAKLRTTLGEGPA